MSATRACELLVQAYDRGRSNDSHVDWSDVDLAHEAAVAALALPGPEATLRRIAAIAVSPEGELLQVCDVLHKAGVLEPVYSLAIHEEARGTPAADLLTAVKALLEWGRDHTSPRDPNSPHELLVAVNAAIVRMERGA